MGFFLPFGIAGKCRLWGRGGGGKGDGANWCSVADEEK